MTNEQIKKAKECKSAEELLALAKENGYELTAEEAEQTYAQLHNEGEMSEDELESATGGNCGIVGVGMMISDIQIGDIVTVDGSLSVTTYQCKNKPDGKGRCMADTWLVTGKDEKYIYTCCTKCGDKINFRTKNKFVKTFV